MSLTVQNVIDDASFESRKVLDGTGGSGADFDLMLRWVDQTHKDLMHTGIYRHALRKTTNITSVAATRSYAITPADIRRVEAVYDVNHERFLTSIAEAVSPVSMADPASRTGGSGAPDKYLMTFRASTPYPQFYWLSTVVTAGTPAHTLHIFPPPETSEHASTLTIYYIKQAPTVSAAATALDAGEDSRDAMAAGVLERLYQYLHDFEAARYWGEKYQIMKMGETIL